MRVDLGALTPKKQPPFKWADCRCPKCRKLHREVVPSSALRDALQADGVKCSVHCDACYREKAGGKAADLYVALRGAIVARHQLGGS